MTFLAPSLFFLFISSRLPARWSFFSSNGLPVTLSWQPAFAVHAFKRYSIVTHTQWSPHLVNAVSLFNTKCYGRVRTPLWSQLLLSQVKGYSHKFGSWPQQKYHRYNQPKSGSPGFLVSRHFQLGGDLRQTQNTLEGLHKVPTPGLGTAKDHPGGGEGHGLGESHFFCCHVWMDRQMDSFP